MNKTARQLSLLMGYLTLGIVQAMSYREWEIAGPKIAKYLMQDKIKIFKGANQYEIHD